MKKIVLLSGFIAFLFAGCTKDRTQTLYLPSTIVYNSASSYGTTIDYVFSYDQDNRVRELRVQGEGTVTFNYNTDNTLNTFIGTDGKLYYVKYADGHISSFSEETDGGGPYATSFDYNNGTYTVASADYTFDTSGDISAINSDLTLSYSQGSGPFADVSMGEDVHLILLMEYQESMLFLLSHKELLKLTDSNGYYMQLNNARGDNGMISTITIYANDSADPQETYTISYTTVLP